MISPMSPQSPDHVSSVPDGAKKTTEKKPDDLSEIRQKMAISSPQNFIDRKDMTEQKIEEIKGRLVSAPSKENIFSKIWQLFKKIFFPSDLEIKEAVLHDFISDSDNLMKEYSKVSANLIRLERSTYGGDTKFNKMRETGKGPNEIDKQEKAQLEKLRFRKERLFQQLVETKFAIQKLSDYAPQTELTLLRLEKLEITHQIGNALGSLLQTFYEAGDRIASSEYSKELRPLLKTLIDAVHHYELKEGQAVTIKADDPFSTPITTQLLLIFMNQLPEFKDTFEHVSTVITQRPSLSNMLRIAVLTPTIPPEPVSVDVPPGEPRFIIPPKPDLEKPKRPPELPYPPAPNVERSIPPREPPPPRGS